VSIILETEKDREVEERAIKRIVEARGGCQSFRFPPMSLVDYLISDRRTHAKAIAFIEIKARKESADQVRSYGGLILKARKIRELAQIEVMMKVPVWAVFPFEDGFGDIYYARPSELLHKEEEAPPIRRNYRGLDCDDEPVVYLDWGAEVLPLILKGES